MTAEPNFSGPGEILRGNPDRLWEIPSVKVEFVEIFIDFSDFTDLPLDFFFVLALPQKEISNRRLFLGSKILHRLLLRVLEMVNLEIWRS